MTPTVAQRDRCVNRSCSVLTHSVCTCQYPTIMRTKKTWKTVRITAERYRWLSQQAFVEGKPISDVLGDLIGMYEAHVANPG
jgi:hypothetical protein